MLICLDAQGLTHGRAPCPPVLVGMQSLRTAVAPRSPCSGVFCQLDLVLLLMVVRRSSRLHRMFARLDLVCASGVSDNHMGPPSCVSPQLPGHTARA